MIEVAGLVLTVVALVVALWQGLLAHRQTKDLSVIGDRLSTKYLGAVPDYFADVQALIEGARAELLVANTLPALGVFNHYSEWLKVKTATELAINRGVKVTCVFADADKRQFLIKKQLREAITNWDQWLNRGGNSAKTRHLAKVFGGGVEITNSERLFELFEVAFAQALNTTYCDADVFDISDLPPLNVWIADTKEAVFAIRTIAACGKSPIFASKHVTSEMFQTS